MNLTTSLMTVLRKLDPEINLSYRQEPRSLYIPSMAILLLVFFFCFCFVLRFYGPVNPMGSCRARSVYLITRVLGRLSPLSG